MEKMQRYVAILTGPDTYLDHVGVLSSILQIPLIVTEEETFLAAKTFYPNLDVRKMGMEELTLDFLATEFDVIFESGKFWKLQLSPLLQLLYRKEIRFVFCPHGNSDKGYSLKNHADQDISLVYGQHMLDLLRSNQAIEKIEETVITGNYRFSYYLKHQSFYDELAYKKVFYRLDPTKKTILYAPTWNDKENPTSFYSSCQKILDQLLSSYNVIVKLHPFLEEFHPAETHLLLSQLEDRPSLAIVHKFPAIYPLLAKTDIYIGDFSSIGYDFLIFDRPMYFISQLEEIKQTEQGRFLHQCGITLSSSCLDQLKEILDASFQNNAREHSTIRKETYAYAFGEMKSFEEIKKNIFWACKKKKASTL